MRTWVGPRTSAAPTPPLRTPAGSYGPASLGGLAPRAAGTLAAGTLVLPTRYTLPATHPVYPPCTPHPHRTSRHRHAQRTKQSFLDTCRRT